MKGIPLYVCSSCCVLTSVVLAILSLFVLDGLFTEIIKENVVMIENTMGLWSQVPGDSKTILVRNFTFYNFTNPEGYLFRNQLPKFTQLTGYAIQQKSKFCNITYSQDRSKISYNYWLHFGDIQASKSLNQTVNVLNLGPLGFWSQLNGVNQSVFTIQGMGQLFVQLNNTLSSQVIGQGVQQQFLTTYKQFQALCKEYQIPQQQCLFLWQDPINGLSDPANYKVWVNAGFKHDKDSLIYLQDYYPIQYSSLQSLLTKVGEWSQSLQEIISNWYCDAEPCTNFELLTKQLSHSGVTNNPPPGTDPTDTICDQNDTCQGYPEISAFTKHILGRQYANITFTQETFAKLLTPNKGLLHIGHLNNLFEWGNKYQTQQNEDLNVKPSYYLAKIQQFFQLQSQDHAYVFWKWIKYFKSQFVLKSSKNGNGKIAGMGAIFSQAFYETFTDFGNWITAEYRSMLLAGNVKNCSNYMHITFTDFSDEKITKLCANVDENNYITYLPLLSPCLFSSENIFTPFQLGMYCDQENQQSIGYIMRKIDASISIAYNCSIQSRCSGYQLALKQFVNSSITLNPLYADERKPAYSVNQWNKQFPAFEYKYFVKYIKNISEPHQINLPWNKLYDLVSFDKLWSGPMIQDLFLSTNQEIIDRFYWPDPVMFKQYLRYIIINVGFGGLVQKRTPYELLFGYKDQFLDNLKNNDPILGGDPSINSIVMLNQPNVTQDLAYLSPQQMYTGIDNPDRVRIYGSISNLDYISYNRSWFDGDKVGWSLDNPHKRKVKLYGTDAFQNKPDYQIGDKCGIYINTLCRGGNMTYDKEVQLYGFKMYRLFADDEMLGSQYSFPQNQKYYQTLEGFINQSYQGLPLFVSFNHMYRAPKNWSEMIEVVNVDGDLQQPNEYDDPFLYIQPKTGTTFVAVLYLQSNLYMGSDVLFTPQLRMLPVFSVYRSGNISEQTANEYFGDVKFILGFSRSLLLICIIFISVCIILVAGYRLSNNNEQHIKKPNSLLQSLDQQKNDQQVE